MSDKKFEPFELKITWTYEDIKDRRPNWSDEKCDEVLGELAGTIEDMSIERGWEVIDSMIHEYDDKCDECGQTDCEGHKDEEGDE